MILRERSRCLTLLFAVAVAVAVDVGSGLEHPQVSVLSFFESLFLFPGCCINMYFSWYLLFESSFFEGCGICEHNDTLSRFSLLSSLQPALWSNHDCFPLIMFLCCKQFLLIFLMVVYRVLDYYLILLHAFFIISF